MAQPLRFGTYTEIQCPPGRDHAELIWDIIALGEHSDQHGFDVFTIRVGGWFGTMNTRGVSDVAGDILKKLEKVGYDHHELSLETVKMFYEDGQKVGYTLYEA